MNTTIIGVAGGTASGKSTLVKKLQEAFEGESVITLCHDYYYKAHDDLSFEERTKLNYDHPGALDTDMMIEDIMKLKKGRSVFRPVYSFVNHNRTDKTVKGTSRNKRRPKRTSGSVSTYTFTSINSRKVRFSRIRIPSIIITCAGSTLTVLSVRL